jgi:glycosyltransferase involved in cell wall biosynthesis
VQIATFTDHPFSPASRFRIRQYTPILQNDGIEVHDYIRNLSTETAAPRDSEKRIRDSCWLISKALLHESANIINRFHDSIVCNKYDVVWLSRQLIIGYPSFESFIRKPLVYDIDDAIFLTGKLANMQFKISVRRATAVIAGNDFLADEASKYCKNISVIPTAVDTRRWKPLAHKKLNEPINADEFIMGWSGTSSSFKYFLPLEQDIKRFLLDFPSVKLFFMSDKFPHELKTLGPYVKFVKWSMDSEVEFIQSLDVGLMPIADDMWSKGKCAYKSLLYAACGIPVVMSPSGVNGKLLNQKEIGFGPKKSEDWYEILRLLFSDRSLGERLGGNGVKLVEKDYSINACAPKIIEILRQSADSM